MSVYWTFLMERTVSGHAVDAVIDIAQLAATQRYIRISLPYMRTDMARNRAARSFLELAQDSNDALIMLDCDHVHPVDILQRLVAHDPQLGVVGSLYFRRGPPYDPLFFRRTNGRLRNPAEWELGMLYQCDAVATGAILIRRWVLDRLIEAGYDYPWFQYTYPEKADFSMTEDIFFASLCEDVNIPHYCDTSIITPHLGVVLIGKSEWDQYKELHPEILADPIEEQEEET